MTSPTICLLCNVPSKSPPIQCDGMLVYMYVNCRLKYGETGEPSVTQKTGSVDTAPQHFSTLLARLHVMGVALAAIIRRLNRWGGAYGKIVPPYHMIVYDAKPLEFTLKTEEFENISISTAAHNDPLYGLVHAHIDESRKLHMVWSLSSLMGLVGNMVAMAQRPLGNGSAALC